MAHTPATSPAPEKVPETDEAPRVAPPDVPELEPFDEDDFDTAFARLETPKPS